MSMQQKFSKAEGNASSRRSLSASLNLSKVSKPSFLPDWCKLTLALVVPVVLGYATAKPVTAATLWYNGDPNGRGATANQRFWVGARSLNEVVLEDFTVPTADVGWEIDTIWSNNLIDPQSSFTQVSWDILTVRPQGVGEPYTYDRFIASGRSCATITPTPFQVSGEPVFRVSVSGVNVRLAPGTYWLIVAPFFDYEDPYPDPDVFDRPISRLATTSGANAVGTPPGNNGNSFTAPYAPTFFPDNRDYSIGIEGEVVPEPSSILSVLAFGAVSLGWRRWRKQKLR
jgi:hypothetical protein